MNYIVDHIIVVLITGWLFLCIRSLIRNRIKGISACSSCSSCSCCPMNCGHRTAIKQ